MYVINFFSRVTRKSNIPALIYLVLNVFIIMAIVQLFFNYPLWKTVIISIALYATSMIIALSPVGEFILRLQTGCKKIKRIEQINRIEPLFQEVYDKAKKLDPTIPNNVRLFISDDRAPNAFATGRKTICVTEGLLHMPKNQIKATLAHEFGHLAHKDTDLILVISVGNLIITAVLTAIRLFIGIFKLTFGIVCIFVGGQEGALASIATALAGIITDLFVVGFMWLWSKIGVLLVLKSSRNNEFEADAFSYHLGYGNDLCMVLDSIRNSGSKGLFANLASSHPNKNNRIARLQKLGVTYRTTYGV